MFGAFILIVILFPLTLAFLGRMKKGIPGFESTLMTKLYWYHMLFAAIYYISVMSSPSDSVEYYLQPQIAYDTWFDAYSTGTHFMHFLGYPFINYLSFSYEMMMVLFSWFGYWGFVCFYIFFKENINFKHSWLGFDLVTLFLFLPNMHYWTASLGKGSIIFFGIGLMTYGLSRLSSRKISLIVGLAIIYHVRPHIFMIMAVGIMLGLFTGRQKVPLYQKMLLLAAGGAAMFLLYDEILAFASVDAEDVMGSFGELANQRASELAKSNSGVDISSYPYPLKLLTFWFRPLFLDSPSMAGFLVSVENSFYLLLTFKLFQSGFLKFLSKSSAIIKTSFVVFVGTSLMMCSTLSNLGIIVRQKTMIMYFFLFLVVAFLDYKKAPRKNRKRAAIKMQKEHPTIQLTN